MERKLQLITTQELAELCGSTANSVRVSSATGGIFAELPIVRLGRAVRYNLSDVEEFISNHTIPTREKEVAV